jgi:hypothetical protein
MEEFDFEGKIVKPNKNGLWKCPFNCGDPRYPQKKWKTKKGFIKHSEKCPKRPSLLKKIEEEQNIKKTLFEKERKEILEKYHLKIGDEIIYIKEHIIKPTHVKRGNRMVKVRYEAVVKYIVQKGIIKKIDINSYKKIIINDHISQFDVYPTMEDALVVASEKQIAYEKHCEFSSNCR